MNWVPIILSVLAIVALILLTRWTDKLGWTRFRGNGRTTAGSVFDVFDQALNAERKAAIEYRLNENTGLHGEQDAEGNDKDGLSRLPNPPK
jgi:hypothetical protein